MTHLKRYLSINAVFSALSGLLIVYQTELLSDFFGLENKFILPIIGFNLLIFAVFVIFVARKQLENRVLVFLIILLDILWVCGSLCIIAFDLFNLTKNGYLVIGILALWIGFLAYKQVQYFKQD